MYRVVTGVMSRSMIVAELPVTTSSSVQFWPSVLTWNCTSLVVWSSLPGRAAESFLMT